MKKNFLKNVIGAGFVGSLMLFSPFPQAEAGIVTDRFPIQMYVDHQLNTYNHAGDSNRAGWADANTDLIRVYSVSNGWARISHPGSGGRTVNRYCRVNELFADPNYSNRGARVKGAQNAYRTSSGSVPIGSVSNNEEVIVLADNGRRAQIIYRLDNGSGYKIGWVPSSAVAAPIPTPADGRMKGDVNGDGKIDSNDLDLLQRYQIGLVDSIPCPKNADINEDRRITLTDISKLEFILNGNTINVPTRNVAYSPSGYAYPLGGKHKFTGANSANNNKNHDHSSKCCSQVGHGAPVYAVSNGTVYYYQRMGYPTDYSSPKRNSYTTVSYGNVAYLQGDNKVGAIYAHLDRFEGVALRENSAKSYYSSLGDQKDKYGKILHTKARNAKWVYCGERTVKAGDVIGYVGTTGNSTGDHLHFEFYINAIISGGQTNPKFSGTRVEPNDYFNK